MKYWGMLLILAVFLICCSLADSGPVGAAGGSRKKIRLEGLDKGSLDFLFKGGERACVIVEGDHDPVVDLLVEVFDANGKLVTKDDQKGDLCAVIWYPPEDAKYTVRVHNFGQDVNIITFVIK